MALYAAPALGYTWPYEFIVIIDASDAGIESEKSQTQDDQKRVVVRYKLCARNCVYSNEKDVVLSTQFIRNDMQIGDPRLQTVPLVLTATCCLNDFQPEVRLIAFHVSAAPRSAPTNSVYRSQRSSHGNHCTGNLHRYTGNYPLLFYSVPFQSLSFKYTSSSHVFPSNKFWSKTHNCLFLKSPKFDC